MSANLITPDVRTNPYVGPQSFRRGDQIYGRDREAADLLDLLVAERIVLLHSPSGAGKTSLLQARLIPLLEQDGFEVLPVVRVNRASPEPREGALPSVNRYVLSTLLSLEEGLNPEGQHSVAQLGSTNLASYMAQRPGMDGRPSKQVIVFDQFEEVITADPVDQDIKAAFFADLGTMLRDRSLWAILAIREDFLAALDPYVRAVPTRLATRYRLDLLTADEALDAMTFPAHDAGVEFEREAARRLVDDLRAVRVQRGTTVTEELGPYVEPVQLQVVCHLMWDRLADDARRIELADVKAIGDVDQALAAYYADCVTSASSASGVPERLLRDWFEQGLITTQGFRGQVMRGPDAGVSGQAVLKLLTDRHLLRSESRRGAVWYELAHDRLVEPIQNDNEAWRAAHLSTFERRATEWEADDRPDRLLLTGEELLERQTTGPGEAQPLTEVEREFLTASKKAQAQAENVVRANARTRRWLRTAVVGLVLALVAAMVAAIAGVRAGQAADNALRSALVGKGFGELNRDTQLGLLLGEEAIRAGGTSPTAEDRDDANLLQLAVSRTPVVRVLQGVTSPAVAVSYSGDGERIAAVHEDGSLAVWAADSGLLQATSPGIGTAEKLALSTNGLVVAVATADGRLGVWDTRGEGSMIADRRFDGALRAIAFSPDGGRLAYATSAGSAQVISTRTGQDQQLLNNKLPVVDLVWSPGAETPIAVDERGSLLTWGDSPGPTTHEQAVGGLPVALDVSPDGKTVATAWDSGDVTIRGLKDEQTDYYLWDVSAVVDVSFTADGKTLLALDDYGQITLADVASEEAPLYAWELGTLPLAIDADPKDTERVVVATGEGSAAIWNVTEGHHDTATALDTALDGTVLTGSLDGTARRWSIDSGEGGVVGEQDRSPVFSTIDQTAEPDGVTTGLRDVVMDPQGRWAVTLDDQGVATVTDIQTHKSQALHDPDGTAFGSIAISPTGDFVATGDVVDPFNVRLWDAASGKPVSVLSGHLNSVTGIAFGPNEEQLVSISADKTARVWDRKTEKPRLTIYPTESTRRGRSANFGVPGDEGFSRVAWGSGQGKAGVVATVTGSSVQLWSLETGELVRTLDAHSKTITDLAFDAAAERLLTTSADYTAVVWDVDSGAVVRRIHQSAVLMAGAFIGAGDRLVLLTQSDTGPVVVWLDRGDLLNTAVQRTTRTFTEEECQRYKEFFTEGRECP